MKTTKDKGAPIPGVQYRLTGGADTPAISNGNTWDESRVGGEADVTSKIKARVEEYCKLITALNAEYYAKNGYTFEPSGTAEATFGPRYARVGIPGRGVHTFIDLRNGDILKSASWKAPAKNGVRGNIFATDLGASAINNHGANYLR